MIDAATLGDGRASFALDLTNPGGRNLVLTRLDYEVSHGESSFPVAHGAWTGELELPAGGRAALSLDTPFDTAPLEPDSELLRLDGELVFTDRTGFLGIGAMDLTRTPFNAEVRATRSAP